MVAKVRYGHSFFVCSFPFIYIPKEFFQSKTTRVSQRDGHTGSPLHLSVYPTYSYRSIHTSSVSPAAAAIKL